MPLRNLAILFVASLVSILCYHKARTNRYASEIAQAIALTEENYIKEVSGRQLFENAMDGMLKDLDPYSGYIRPEPMERFDELMNQEKIGIGVMIDPEAAENRLVILTPLPGSPAEKAGVLPGDEIVAVGGQTLAKLGGVEKAIEQLRGPAGSLVKISVRREGAADPIELSMERYEFVLDSVIGDLRKPGGGWSFRLQGHPDVGYLRIDSFGEKTGDELNAALATYEKEPVDALIIDLRDNPGGMLDAAVAACDAFIAGGTIVSTRGRDNEIRRIYSAQPVVRFPVDVPIVILVNGNSASAAEIFAACLQDHGRATVVGERTYGKGTVQTVIRMEGGKSALKLTTASYWRPSEHNIHRFPEDGPEKEWGVMPDEGMVVPLTDEQRIARYRWRRRRDVAELVHAPQASSAEGPAAGDDSIEANDPQLAKALDVAEKKIRRQQEALEAA